MLTSIGSAMVFSQSDGLKRRGSFSSTAGAFDMASMSDYDYKGPDDTTDLDGVKGRYGRTQSDMTGLDDMRYSAGADPMAHGHTL
jgi:regulator of nonsense transcripts 1